MQDKTTELMIVPQKVKEVQTKITELVVMPLSPRLDRLVGLAFFVYDDAFYFRAVQIHSRPNGGYRLIYPRSTYKTSSGKLIYSVFCRPNNKEIGDAIEEVVIKKYEENVPDFCIATRQ